MAAKNKAVRRRKGRIFIPYENKKGPSWISIAIFIVIPPLWPIGALLFLKKGLVQMCIRDRSVTERSAVVRFKVKGEENTYLYAWTTTPWTLPSNVALCVNPDETYAKFDCEGRTVIMGCLLYTSRCV